MKLYKRILVVLVLLFGLTLYATDRNMRVFVQPGCADCDWIQKEYLPEVLRRFPDMEVVLIDTSTHDGLLVLLDVLDKVDVEDNSSVYIALPNGKVLSGVRNIKEFDINELVSVVHHIDTRLPDEVVPSTVPQRFIRKLTIPTIIMAGLVDGFNPCAFSIVVFLASLLASSGKNRSKRLLGGWSFCIASYTTYVLMGFGLLRAMRAMEIFQELRTVVFSVLAVAMFILGILSFRDAYLYCKHKVPSVITLQLPSRVKNTMRNFAIARWNGAVVIVSGLIIGFVITLLDSLCTGQIYIPVLALLSRQSLDFNALILLLLYNLAFIAPLVILFVCSAYGIDSSRMQRWSKGNVVPAKVGLGVMFFVLTIFIIAETPAFQTKPVFALSRIFSDHSSVVSLPEIEHTESSHDLLYKIDGDFIQNLNYDLKPEMVARCIDALIGPDDVFAAGFIESEVLAARNQVLDILSRQNTPVSDLPWILMSIINEQSHLESWREHCLQLLPEALLTNSAEYGQCVDAVVRCLNANIENVRSLLSGTALMGLARLCEAGLVESSVLDSTVLQCVFAQEACASLQATAIRLVGDRKLSSALPTIRKFAQISTSSIVRCVSITVLGELGGREDAELLLSIAHSTDARIKTVAEHAFAVLLRREGDM